MPSILYIYIKKRLLQLYNTELYSFDNFINFMALLFVLKCYFSIKLRKRKTHPSTSYSVEFVQICHLMDEFLEDILI